MTVSTARLQAYATQKNEVIRAIRAVQQLLSARDGRSGAQRAADLLTRLAEDRFNLVVLGQFKRGKSSLINAVVGKELLPTASVPLTSAVTALRYGPAEKVVIQRQGWTIPQEVPVAALPEFVTERGNPKNEKGVLSAEVRVPSPFLRRGLYFIDTPGVGSIHEHNTATTYAFLPQADAVIFVTSADAPMGETETAFLGTIRQHVRKIFFVLNKIDTVPDQDRAEVIAFTEAALREQMGGAPVRLFPISARLGLEGKQRDDPALLEQSGLPAVEAALAGFLAEEKGQVFLVALLDRALRLLAAEERMLDLERRAAEEPPSALDAQVAGFRRRLEALRQERAAIFTRMRQSLQRWVETALDADLAAFAAEQRRVLPAELEAVARQHERLDSSEFFRKLSDWLLLTLYKRWIGWVKEARERIGTAVRAIVLEETEPLRRTLREIERAAEESFAIPASGAESGVTEPDGPLPDGPSFRSYVAPELEVPMAPLDLPFLTCLPGRIARPLILRRIREKVDQEVPRAQARVHERLVGSLDQYVDLLVMDLEAKAAEAQRAMERPILSRGHPDEGRTSRRTPTPDRRAASVVDQETLMRQLVALRDHLTSLRAAILDAPLPETGRAGDGVVPPAEASAPARPEQGVREDGLSQVAPSPRRPVALSGDAPSPKAAASHLPEGIRGRGCVLCPAVLASVREFMAGWQYELATDEAAQEAYASTRGFCRFHAWQLGEMASPRALCAGYPPLVDRTVRSLRAMAGMSPRQSAERLSALLPGASGCRACEAREQSEHEYVRQLLRLLGTAEGRQEYRRSQGVCLPHLQALLAAAPPPEAECGGATPGPLPTATFLLEEQARRLEELANDLNGYAVKFDAHRRELMSLDERDAANRAVILLTGEPGIR